MLSKSSQGEKETLSLILRGYWPLTAAGELKEGKGSAWSWGRGEYDQDTVYESTKNSVFIKKNKSLIFTMFASSFLSR